MHKMLLGLLSMSSLVFGNSLEIDQGEISKLLSSITEKQRALEKELDQLREVLGVQTALSDITPVLDAKITEKTREITQKGIDAFSARNYEMAKEHFYAAWEKQPENATTSFNLGLVYHRLGNGALGRKLLKTALELDPDIKTAAEIKRYLVGETSSSKKKEIESDDLKKARTEIINLRKEADSYLASRTIELPERVAAAAALLRKIEKIANEHQELVEEYFLDVSERYAIFEMYDKALAVLKRYEEEMKEKVLPDGYHKTLLNLQEKQKEQEAELARYLNPDNNQELEILMQKDLRELGIFARQIEQFVETPKPGNPDFDKVCHRLKEYRWGKKARRHVIIADRFQRLLFSSLSGTLPLDQYQDVKGDKFFKNICLLSDKLEKIEPQWVSIDLSVKGVQTPYLLLYAYLPRHEAFLMVRIPEHDVNN